MYLIYIKRCQTSKVQFIFSSLTLSNKMVLLSLHNIIMFWWRNIFYLHTISGDIGVHVGHCSVVNQEGVQALRP